MAKTNLLLRRIIVFLIGVLIIIGGVFGCKKIQSLKQPRAVKAAVEQIRTVEAVTAKNASIEYSIPIQGRTTAFKKVDITTEVSGVLRASARTIKPGARFNKGEVMLNIDATELSAAIKAQRSELVSILTRMMPDLKIDFPERFDVWNTYLSTVDIGKSLLKLPEPTSERERLFVNGRSIYTSYYAIKQNEVRLAKYVVRAPFSGVVLNGDLQLSTMITQGKPLITLVDPKNYELATPVTLSDLKYIKVGNKVQLQNPDTKQVFTARVARIADDVQSTTQSVIVYLSIKANGLKENMYLTGKVAVQPIADAVRLPRTALFRGNSVFVIKDNLLKQQEIELITRQNETIIVKGIDSGVQVLSSVFPGVSTGVKVNVYEPKK